MPTLILGPISPTDTELHCYEALVPAGFPSPALDHQEQKISLDTLLDIRAPHTYLVQVSGDSMQGAGIFDGDMLIVSRALEAKSGHIVVACINGEVFVKRLSREHGQIILRAENPRYAPRYVLDGEDFQIWGVVTHSILKHHHA
jgi:DNA polymerase V